METTSNTTIEEKTTEQVRYFYYDHEDEMNHAYEQYKESLTDKFDRDYYVTSPESLLVEELSKSPILILTANPVETSILHSWICKGTSINDQVIKRIIKGDITYNFIKWNDYNVVNVWAGTTGSHTEQGSSWTMRKVFEDYTPKIVLSLGVAFGISWEDQQFGDVLVSKKVHAYDKGIKLVNDRLDIKNDHSFTINPWLGERFRQKRSFFVGLDRGFRVQYGNIVTGEAVVDDPKAKDLIRAAVGSEIIGGEMEGFGLFSECHNKGIPCAVIKGICDWGTGKNALHENKKINEEMKDSLQAYAMINVLSACNTLFQDANLFKGSITLNILNDPAINRYTNGNKAIAFFRKNQSLFYFFLNLIFVIIAAYRLMQNVRLNYDAIIVIAVIVLFIICFFIFALVFNSQKTILQKVLTSINNMIIHNSSNKE